MNKLEEIIFCDMYEDFPSAIAKLLPSEIKYGKNIVKISTYADDIRKIHMDNRTAYVSPANSFLDFDGGIDMIYNKMFPYLNSESKLIAIKMLPDIAKNKRHYLPVGSALVIPVIHAKKANANKKCKKKDKNELKKHELTENYIIAAPTMFKPKLVPDTKHAYSCFLAVLYVLEKSKINVKRLIVPGLCTGCGGFSGELAATQIKEAIDNYMSRIDYKDKSDNPFYYYCDKDEVDIDNR